MTLAMQATGVALKTAASRPSLLVRTMRLWPNDTERRHRVWLGADPGRMGLTTSVQGLAFVYANRDDLSRHTLKANGMVITGDTPIRDWCRENIPDLIERACALAAAEDPR